jgi:hypothetical protein
MRFGASILGGFLILLGLLFTGVDGAHKLRVVTTIPDFKALDGRWRQGVDIHRRSAANERSAQALR